MPVLTGIEISHSNGQTETGAKTEYTTLLIIATSINENPNLSQWKH
jgi:hypothetical protein